MKSTVTILGLMACGHFAETVNIDASAMLYLLASSLALAAVVNLWVHQKKRK